MRASRTHASGRCPARLDAVAASRGRHTSARRDGATRRTSACKCGCTARGPGDPSADHRGRVRPVGVHDDVHVQLGRPLDSEGGHEGATRDRAMPPTNLTPHVSRLHGQGGKARRRPVPVVVVGPPVSVARAQGEHRRRAIPGLDLRRVVDAEARGVRRRIELHPHEGRGPCRCAPDPGDRVTGFVRCGCSPKSLPDARHTHRTSLVSPTWFVLLRRTVTRMPSASPAPATSAHHRAATRGSPAPEGVPG